LSSSSIPLQVSATGGYIIYDKITNNVLNYLLSQNYPNQFNSATNLEYILQKEGEVVLKILDVIGKEIKTLVNQSQQRDNYKLIWNGTDNNGEVVSRGIYFYRLQIDKATITKKAIYIK